MSVGHLARVLESAGIPTVVVGIQAFRVRLEAMRIPRLLLTPYLLGRTLGVPHDAAGQLRVVRTALRLLDEAKVGGDRKSVV